jgi:two-component sensor histidine kinase
LHSFILKPAESLRATLEDCRPLRARFRIHRRNGSLAHIIARGTAIRDDMNAVDGVSGSFFDVTDEENARLAMQSSLTEKETLLGEIHHRVKNNMQVVSSLLSLQANKIEEPRCREVFEDCRSRIRTMAAIHETLYASRNFAAIDAGAYTREIAQTVFMLNAHPNNQVQLMLALEPVMLDMASVIPLGLIINELVGNALKHAFTGRSKGNVRVSLTLVDETVQLCVSDDGVGMRNNASSENANGMGLRLVRILTQQIDGEVAWTTDHGTSCTLRFHQPSACASMLATGAAAEQRK